MPGWGWFDFLSELAGALGQFPFQVGRFVLVDDVALDKLVNLRHRLRQCCLCLFLVGGSACLLDQVPGGFAVITILCSALG